MTSSTVPLVINGSDDGFDVVGRANTAQTLALRLRFRKGDWVRGNDEGIMNGAILAAYRFDHRWDKWHDKEVVDSIVPVPGEPFPLDAEDIADDGSLGEWQYVAQLFLRDLDDCRDFEFSTSSQGGCRAIEELKSQTRKMRRRKTGALPVVRLDSSTFYSKRHRTDVVKPLLTVVSWVDADGNPYRESNVKAASEDNQYAELGNPGYDDMDIPLP